MNEQSIMMLETLKEFLADSKADTMYVTGAAGTGKTTDTKHMVQYCLDNNVNTVVAAFTHKAVGILAKKMPEKAVLKTLHSFLKKRPSFNQNATKVQHVDTNVQVGTPEDTKILFVDEFSMIGEKDFASIQACQWNEDGKIKMKVVFIGDLNQLPPVKDMQTITPKGKYWVHLTKIYRQADTNPLLDTLCQLVSFIEGKVEPEPLQEHTTFKRNQDLIEGYQSSRYQKIDSILLAYTNERVQELNAAIEGRTKPRAGDKVYSPTTKEFYTIVEFLDQSRVNSIVAINGDSVEADSKYKTLEVIKRIKPECEFALLENENGEQQIRAYIFGHGSYNSQSKYLAKLAVEANNAIKRRHQEEPRNWAMSNRDDPLAKDRAKYWSIFLSFNACVICLDFTHAMTVHKSQGSTYAHVFVDTEDLAKCADMDYTLYLKLMYVAFSRASGTVYTN